MSNIRIVLMVIISAFILCSCSNYESNKVQVQKERIEILEQAKNSSDPAVLKQAELVRMDIDKDYESMKNEQETKDLVYIIACGLILIIIFTVKIFIGY